MVFVSCYEKVVKIGLRYFTFGGDANLYFLHDECIKRFIRFFSIAVGLLNMPESFLNVEDHKLLLVD
jgi:hypothetical protein